MCPLVAVPGTASHCQAWPVVVSGLLPILYGSGSTTESHLSQPPCLFFFVSSLFFLSPLLSPTFFCFLLFCPPFFSHLFSFQSFRETGTFVVCASRGPRGSGHCLSHGGALGLTLRISGKMLSLLTQSSSTLGFCARLISDS